MSKEVSTVEFTLVLLTEIAGELKAALEQAPEAWNKEEKRVLREKKRQIKALESHGNKLEEYKVLSIGPSGV